MASRSRRWSDDELVLAFELYCITPFGRLHQHNPDIISLAEQIDRTPSAIAMKLVNFASLDETQRSRGIKGLSNASNADKRVVQRFRADWSALAEEAEAVRSRYNKSTPPAGLKSSVESIHDELAQWDETRPMERETAVRVRLAQRFFRAAILASYESTCAVCGIRHESLLIASHIVPWSQDAGLRADPSNGICMCAIHDRAFDRGLLAIDTDFKVVVGESLLADSERCIYQEVFSRFAGNPLRLPSRFHPDPDALRYHFESVFRA